MHACTHACIQMTVRGEGSSREERQGDVEDGEQSKVGFKTRVVTQYPRCSPSSPFTRGERRATVIVDQGRSRTHHLCRGHTQCMYVRTLEHSQNQMNDDVDV